MQIVRIILLFSVAVLGAGLSETSQAKTEMVFDRLVVGLDAKEWKQFDSNFIFNRPLRIFEKKDGKARGFLETEIGVVPGETRWRDEIQVHCDRQATAVKAAKTKVFTSETLKSALVCQFKIDTKKDRMIYTLVYSQPPKLKRAIKVQSLILTFEKDSRAPASTDKSAGKSADEEWIVKSLGFRSGGAK
ncbi:MAG: hypothetical protein V4692_07855 [Bdellovibrionota bacterium]